MRPHALRTGARAALSSKVNAVIMLISTPDKAFSSKYALVTPSLPKLALSFHIRLKTIHIKYFFLGIPFCMRSVSANPDISRIISAMDNISNATEISRKGPTQLDRGVVRPARRRASSLVLQCHTKSKGHHNGKTFQEARRYIVYRHTRTGHKIGSANQHHHGQYH